MDEKIVKLREMIEGSGSIVFFGGAGVSTESGIPDFRSVDGLYSQKYKYPPEEILSGSFFRTHPGEFYEFYHDKLTLHDVKPNQAHIRLAELEKQGKLKAIITQNIDGLHQAAGSKNVLELHGTIHRFYCTSCGKDMPGDEANSCKGVPHCSCGGIVRPDVVLYEESLNTGVLSEAIRHISECDMLIVGGTSLNVYPAAGLITYYKRKKLVLINKQATPFDGYANLIINGKIGEVFAQV
ncbi:MAG: NAD-dependent protein deacylase [Clostridiales bacterium]|jgi:NAD-dependent deacetylase|nr:NAD-dependent protein deacylase [Clostridiales bacterium]